MDRQRIIPAAIALCGVIAAGTLFGQAAYRLAHPESVRIEAPAAPRAARARAPRPTAPAADFRRAEDLNLFGVRTGSRTEAPAAAVDASAAEGAEGLPESRRGFELLGTMVAAGGASRAVIAAGGAERTYAPGESVKDWKVAAITRRAVVLEKDGRRERLSFKSEAPAKGSSSAPGSLRTPDGPVRLDAGRLASIMRDPAALAADMAALSPHAEKGRNGLLVGHAPRGGLIEMLGLRDGDLLLRAGRRTTARLSDLTGLASDFGSRRLAPELEILRGGAATLIRYQLD